MRDKLFPLSATRPPTRKVLTISVQCDYRTGNLATCTLDTRYLQKRRERGKSKRRGEGPFSPATAPGRIRMQEIWGA